jgi:hypothetical protein
MSTSNLVILVDLGISLVSLKKTKWTHHVPSTQKSLVLSKLLKTKVCFCLEVNQILFFHQGLLSRKKTGLVQFCERRTVLLSISIQI